MKKIVSISVIILCFVCFVIFETVSKSTVPVLGVLNASTIKIDFNKNGLYDIGETVCIPEVETLTSDLSTNQSELTQKLGITFEEGIKFGQFRR